MELSIALIVLLAALFHAIWNATVKSGADHLITITGLIVFTCLIAVVLLPVVGFPNAASLPYMFASVFLHCGYYVALSEAYRYGDFSQAYPVARGSAPVFVSLWAVLVLDEALSDIEIVSLIGVLIGIFIFASRGFQQVMQHPRALCSALITALFIGSYTIVDGIGGRLSNNVLAYLFYMSTIECIILLSYTVYKRSLAEVIAIRHNWKILLLGAALALTSYSMVVWSMTQASIPLVSALRETSIIIAALIGAFYFKEPSGKRRIVASIVIFCSIALLAVDGF